MKTNNSLASRSRDDEAKTERQVHGSRFIGFLDLSGFLIKKRRFQISRPINALSRVAIDSNELLETSGSRHLTLQLQLLHCWLSWALLGQPAAFDNEYL